ncbi:MAG: Xaa-Pro peptidase family protein [Fervidicoccaceae archaeon]
MVGFEKARARRILSHDLSAVLVVAGPNFFYLTGKNIKSFERPLLLLATRDDCLVVAPKFEEERIADINCGDTILYKDGEDPFFFLSPETRSLGIRSKDKIGLDPNMNIDTYFSVARVLSDFSLVSAKEAILYERMKKDDYELESIVKASSILDRLFKEAESMISEGVTEAEVYMNLILLSSKLGADESQLFSVQSGPNTALPHHEYSDRVMKKGDLVLLDLALSVDGYYADLTRVYSLGEPSEEVRRTFEVVSSAVEKGMSSVKVGLQGNVVDSAVREEIRRNGMENFFTHRTGHGLGIEVHELPNIAPASLDTIEERSVFTVEPGVYYAGKFGIRLEVDLIAWKKGIDLVGEYPLELRIL